MAAGVLFMPGGPRAAVEVDKKVYPMAPADSSSRKFYDDDELNARITEELMFTDFSYALSQGFTPTSKTMPPSGNWGGKYRCIFCTRTGYFWKGGGYMWWGNNHGNNCRKATI